MKASYFSRDKIKTKEIMRRHLPGVYHTFLRQFPSTWWLSCLSPSRVVLRCCFQFWPSYPGPLSHPLHPCPAWSLSLSSVSSPPSSFSLALALSSSPTPSSSSPSFPHPTLLLPLPLSCPFLCFCPLPFRPPYRCLSSIFSRLSLTGR